MTAERIGADGAGRETVGSAALTAESTSRFVQAGEVRVHYHEAGEGPVLLCIHGGAPGAYGWGNFGQNLPAFSRRFRTLIVDLPGYGKSDKPVITGGRFSFYGETFKAMLDALGIRKAHIIGLATGGGAALSLALDHPEYVDRLVLVSSAGALPLTTPTPSEGMKMIQSYYGGSGPSLERMRAYLEMAIYDHSLITDELVRERYEASVEPEFAARPPEGKGRRAPHPDDELWRRLQDVQAKTLVVWGRENRVNGFDQALFMFSRIPDVEVHLFGKTGLWVPFEKAARFESLVTGFLQED